MSERAASKGPMRVSARGRAEPAPEPAHDRKSGSGRIEREDTAVAFLRLDDLRGRWGRKPRESDGRDGQARRVALAGHDVDYRLLRARRRSIGMQIDLSGLTVRAPRWVTIRDIEEALSDRAAWIVRTLAEWRSRRRDVLPSEWVSGAPILYRGRELALAVYPARKKTVAADLINLTVLHPVPQDERQIESLVARWLKDEAFAALAPRVAEYAARIVPAPPPVKLSNARTEWGSCNQKGEIRLNWRLIQLPPALADYVVAHEVAHLVELNHSVRFWSLVESIFPGHDEARRTLDDWTALLEA